MTWVWGNTAVVPVGPLLASSFFSSLGGDVTARLSYTSRPVSYQRRLGPPPQAIMRRLVFTVVALFPFLFLLLFLEGFFNPQKATLNPYPRIVISTESPPSQSFTKKGGGKKMGKKSLAAVYGVHVLRVVFLATLVGWIVVLAIDLDKLFVKWILWGVTTLIIVIENNWVMKKSVLERHLLHCDKDPRIRPLHRKKIKHHFARREAMVDIVDTFFEKIRHSIHDNKFKLYLEGKWKTFLKDKTGDALGSLESDIAWGTKWETLGKRMHGVEVAFGDAMRKLYFDADSGYLDSASGGLVPRPVRDGRSQWDKANQVNPVVWRFQSLPFRLQQGRSRIAAEIASDPDDTVFVASAAEALSCLVRCLPWQTGDRLLYLSAGGDGKQFEPLTQFAQRTYGVEALECKLPLPCSDVTIVQTIEKFLKKQTTLPVLVVFAHVMPNGWLLPAKQLTRLFHKYSISVAIDGTLAIGQIPVQVSQIGADWYTASFSSFCYSFGGSGFLVTNPLKQDVTSPLTVSYFDGQGYVKEFSYYGLRDFSSWLSVMDAFDFVQKVCQGFSMVRKYCRYVAHMGEKVIRDTWGESFTPFQGRRPSKGDHVCLAPGRNGDACIRFQEERAVVLNDNFGERPYLVQGARGVKLWYAQKGIRLATLPFATKYGLMPTFRIPNSKGIGEDGARSLQLRLLRDHKLTVHMFSATFNQSEPYLYARCSVGIHNTVDDFKRFANAVIQMGGKYD